MDTRQRPDSFKLNTALRKTKVSTSSKSHQAAMHQLNIQTIPMATASRMATLHQLKLLPNYDYPSFLKETHPILFCNAAPYK